MLWSVTLNNVEFRKSRDFFGQTLRRYNEAISCFAWNVETEREIAWSPAWKRLTVSVKKIICRIILLVWMNIALRLECYSTAAFRKVLIFFWNARCGEILSVKDQSFSVNHDLPCHNFECLHQLREGQRSQIPFINECELQCIFMFLLDNEKQHGWMDGIRQNLSQVWEKKKKKNNLRNNYWTLLH